MKGMLRLLILVSLSSQYFPVSDKLWRCAANFSYTKQMTPIKENSFTERKSVTYFCMFIFIIVFYPFILFLVRQFIVYPELALNLTFSLSVRVMG